MVRIQFFRNKCIGCNACVEAAPNRLRVSRKDGKCVLIGGKAKKGIYRAIVHHEEWEENKLAAQNCPVNIIRLEEV
jgi:ferredoxin